MNTSKIIQDLEKIEGLSNIKLIEKEDKQSIMELEDKNNFGVIECIKRNYTLVLTHDERFREPAGEIVINKVIFPPVPFPEIKAKNVVSSSPSENVHNFLVKKYNLKILNNDATLLIGFDEIVDIIAIVRDIFFAAKIKETANQLNLSVLFIYDAKELQEVKDKPRLIILDLNSNLIEDFNLIKRFNVRTICYLSHTQINLREKALGHGFDEIMPKSKFSLELPNILKSLA